MDQLAPTRASTRVLGPGIKPATVAYALDQESKPQHFDLWADTLTTEQPARADF